MQGYSLGTNKQDVVIEYLHSYLCGQEKKNKPLFSSIGNCFELIGIIALYHVT
jgi:hypothetical protein